ncbi:GIY-YIG nuclease family protein [Pseudomonas sp. D47]|uniref:GIY-YIG nuclease family protein n=1 Tax=Pseudomonas sp. D47 TaxID=3159447 RepID=UPI00387AD9ED
MKKLTTEQFIEKSRLVHGEAYDYSSCKYVNSRTPVSIVCKLHGEFLQIPNAHLVGSGCNACGYLKCSKKRRQDKKLFVEKAVSVHGDRYLYEDVVYAGAHGKVNIKCTDHGEFAQDARSHLKGSGCPKCAISRHVRIPAKPLEHFIYRAKKAHGEKYVYSKSIYIGGKRKVEITCKTHGSFWQCAADHMKGSGCPGCREGGFNTLQVGYLYVLRSAEFIKIGISNNATERMISLKRDTPFGFECLYVEKGCGKLIAAREKSLHKKFTRANVLGFPGYTEWFEIVKDFMEVIVNE